MPVYQIDVGVNDAPPLTTADVGNTPNPDRLRNPDGTPGRCNGDAATGEGTIYFREAGTVDGYLSPDDVDGLATYFGVQPRSVERWFGIPGPHGQAQYRNCVPLASVGHAPYALPQVNENGTGAGAFQRFLLAACLTVQGGVQRDPIFTKGTKASGYTEPYLETIPFTTLVDAVQWITAMMDGEVNELLQQGWVQVTIEAYSGGGWAVYVFHFYPRAGENSNFDDLPTGDTEALGDESQ